MAKRGNRARTVPVRRMTRASLAVDKLCYPETDYFRPRTRGECGVERPCPYVGCRYHLFIDVNEETGSIKFVFPGVDVCDMKHTCALDIAERGGVTLDETGSLMNICRERVRQIEEGALGKIRLVDENGVLYDLFVLMKTDVEPEDDSAIY